jgi:hypothetical protein
MVSLLTDFLFVLVQNSAHQNTLTYRPNGIMSDLTGFRRRQHTQNGQVKLLWVFLCDFLKPRYFASWPTKCENNWIFPVARVLWSTCVTSIGSALTDPPRDGMPLPYCNPDFVSTSARWTPGAESDRWCERQDQYRKNSREIRIDHRESKVVTRLLDDRFASERGDARMQSIYDLRWDCFSCTVCEDAVRSNVAYSAY